MLLQIREYIQRHQLVSTQQLAREFHIDEQALQPILDVWLSKQVIKRCDNQDACRRACGGCAGRAPVYYQIRSTPEITSYSCINPISSFAQE
jgi:hypothetical protein